MKVEIKESWRLSHTRPFYIQINGNTLCNDKGVVRKFSTHESAKKAADKYAKENA